MEPITMTLLALLAATAAGGTGAAMKGGKQGLSDFFMGTDPYTEQLPALSPEQSSYQNQLLGNLSQMNPQMMKFLQQFMGNDEESMNQYAAPFMRQFQTKVVPGIREAFMGGDSGGSSGFMNMLGEAGTDLQERLASGRQQMGLSAIDKMQGFNQTAMQAPFGYSKYDSTPGAIQGILNALAGMGKGK